MSNLETLRLSPRFALFGMPGGYLLSQLGRIYREGSRDLGVGGIGGLRLNGLAVVVPPLAGIGLTPPRDVTKSGQPLPDFARALRPVPTILGQTLHDQILELGGQLTPEPF